MVKSDFSPRFWLIVSLFALSFLAVPFGTVVAAGVSGRIQSLSATSAPNPGDMITVSTTVRAQGNIQVSNFYFEIRAPDGTVVATHEYGGVPAMDIGDTFSYSWIVNNSSFPLQGDYVVTLCWSTGNARNCDIAAASSAFYSANTLGVFLTATLFGLFGAWLWRLRRTLFGWGEAE